jgi:hypothetical protein
MQLDIQKDIQLIHDPGLKRRPSVLYGKNLRKMSRSVQLSRLAINQASPISIRLPPKFGRPELSA